MSKQINKLSMTTITREMAPKICIEWCSNHNSNFNLCLYLTLFVTISKLITNKPELHNTIIEIKSLIKEANIAVQYISASIRAHFGFMAALLSLVMSPIFRSAKSQKSDILLFDPLLRWLLRKLSKERGI